MTTTTATPALLPRAVMRVAFGSWVFTAFWILGSLVAGTSLDWSFWFQWVWVGGLIGSNVVRRVLISRMYARAASHQGLVCTNCLRPLADASGACPGCGEPFAAGRTRASWDVRAFW